MSENRRNEFVMQGSFFAHRALMRDTEMLVALARRVELMNRQELASFRKWYGFYWDMMEQHHSAEDDILFIEIEKRLNRPSEIIEGMEVEHTRLQFLIDEIKRLIGEAERNDRSMLLIKTDLEKYAAELLELFSHHIREEEKYVHEKMTAHFTPQEQNKIEERVKRKAPVRYLSYMIPWLNDALTGDEKRIWSQTLPWSAKVFNYFFWRHKYERIVSPVKEIAEKTLSTQPM
jgi:hemerythrin-like domain-containing protein